MSTSEKSKRLRGVTGAFRFIDIIQAQDSFQMDFEQKIEVLVHWSYSLPFHPNGLRRMAVYVRPCDGEELAEWQLVRVGQSTHHQMGTTLQRARELTQDATRKSMVRRGFIEPPVQTYEHGKRIHGLRYLVDPFGRKFP